MGRVAARYESIAGVNSLGSVERLRTANRRFLSSAVLIGMLSAATGLAMLGRESMTARLFGRSDEIDAFLVAALIPMFLVNATGNSIGAGFVPTLLRVRHDEGQRSAAELLSAFLPVVGALVLGAMLVAALLFPLALPWLARGFSTPKRDLALHLFYLLLPLVAIGALAKFWLAILNGYERFVAGSLIPIAVPIAVIVLLWSAPPGAALDFLVAGVALGFALQLLIAFAVIGRAGLPRWPRRVQRIKPLIADATRQYFAMLAGTLTLMLLEVVDTVFASMQPPGTVAAINYASKLSVLVLGFAGTALATAVVPHYARMRATTTQVDQRRFLRFGESLSLGGGALLTVALVVLSTSLVTFVYNGGRFDVHDVAAVSKLNALYAMQAPAFLAGVLYGRLLLVEGHSRVLFVGAVLSVGCSLVANLVLAPWIGGSGIPVAGTIAYVASALWLRTRLLAVLRVRTASEASDA